MNFFRDCQSTDPPKKVQNRKHTTRNHLLFKKVQKPRAENKKPFAFAEKKIN